MATGNDIVVEAMKHLGEEYILGADVPFENPDYKGPWDCAEFCSWIVYQVSGLVYGCVDNSKPIKKLEPGQSHEAIPAYRLTARSLF